MTRFPYDPRSGLYAGGAEFGLPRPPEAPALAGDALELLVRFEHPGKFLAVLELPGGARLSDSAVAEAYAIAPDRLCALRDALHEQARAAAEELLEDHAVLRAVQRFPPGVVVALGDSITDDLLSWAEILRACLAIAGCDDVVLINAGVSGDTTSDVLRRLHGIVALAPDLVVTMLGTNDCQRHGPASARIVSASATQANLVAIARWVRDAGAAMAWLTPPPVDEAGLAAAVGSRLFAVRDADVAEVGRVISGLGGPVVDVRELLRDDPAALLPDGVHPSLTGQKRIAAAVLATLT